MGKVIEISSVSKYFDEKCVLDQFSLSVNKGEFIVILGPSGCGKSTLLRIICGLEVPDSGIIKIDGEFFKGDNILIVDQNGNDCARGIVSFSSDEINKVKGLKSDQLESILGYPTKSEIIHRDDMVKL